MKDTRLAFSTVICYSNFDIPDKSRRLLDVGTVDPYSQMVNGLKVVTALIFPHLRFTLSPHWIIRKTASSHPSDLLRSLAVHVEGTICFYLFIYLFDLFFFFFASAIKSLSDFWSHFSEENNTWIWLFYSLRLLVYATKIM